MAGWRRASPPQIAIAPPLDVRPLDGRTRARQPVQGSRFPSREAPTRLRTPLSGHTTDMPAMTDCPSHSQSPFRAALDRQPVRELPAGVSSGPRGSRRVGPSAPPSPEPRTRRTRRRSGDCANPGTRQGPMGEKQREQAERRDCGNGGPGLGPSRPPGTRTGESAVLGGAVRVGGCAKADPHRLRDRLLPTRRSLPPCLWALGQRRCA